MRRLCSQCGESKEFSEFHKKKGGKHGLRSECKECSKKNSSEYYSLNKEKWKYNPNLPEERKSKKKESDRQYRIRNKDKEKARHKKYHEENQEAIKEKSKAHYHENKEKYAEYSRNYRKSHPIWHCITQHRRRLKVKENGGSFTQGEWEQLLELYGHSCLKCGKTGIPLTIDHIKPIDSGGSNSIDNIQPLCKPCNSSKGTKTIDYRRT